MTCEYPPCDKPVGKCVMNSKLGGHAHMCTFHGAMTALYEDNASVVSIEVCAEAVAMS